MPFFPPVDKKCSQVQRFGSDVRDNYFKNIMRYIKEMSFPDSIRDVF